MAEIPGYDQIDWADAWKQRALRNATDKNKKECSLLWQDLDHAARYDMDARAGNWQRGRRLIGEINVTAGSRVLDIGAGSGTLTIPIAPLVRHVTAIEPADGMMWYLKKNVSEAGLDNVTCIREKWEQFTAPRGTYDVVVASMSLGMPEIRTALRKMNDVASGYVYLFWPAGPTYWERNYAEIWKDLHGKEFRYGSKCDCLYNILYGMGIYPNVKVYKDDYRESFSSVEEAVAHFKPFYQVGDDRQEKILREFLHKKLVKCNGHLSLRGYSDIAKIWWKKQDSDDELKK